MSIRRISYSPKKQITSQVIQPVGTFLWVAFAKNSSNNCLIEKQFAFNPTQIYFSLPRAVDAVVDMDINSTHLFVAYDDTDLLGEIISLTSPLTSTVEIEKPVDVESPVAVELGIEEDVWFLLPGSDTGENAQLLRYDLDGILLDTLDLADTAGTVFDASSFTIDSNGDLWIGTMEAPGNVVRVYKVVTF